MTSVPPFDAAALCEAFEHDLEMIQELVALVVRDLPRYVQSLETAADAGDLVTVGRAGHTIKGAVGNVCAGRLCDIAEGLEQAGRAQDGARVAALRPQLRSESQALLAALSAWLERAASRDATSGTAVEVVR